MGVLLRAGRRGTRGTACALAEWRAAAGLGPCPPELGVGLLAPALTRSLQCDSVWGDELVEFFRAVPRLFRRAAALTDSLGRLLPRQRSGGLANAVSASVKDFLDRHAGHASNSPDARGAAEEALELILAEWGPDTPPDERTFYACPPHRIETCASILRDTYEPGPVNNALPLLTVWVQWCAMKRNSTASSLTAPCPLRARRRPLRRASTRSSQNASPPSAASNDDSEI